MASKLIPLADKLVLRPIVQEEVLSSGIVIPDTAKEKPNQGEIIAVGPGRRDEDGKIVPMDVSVGDRVLYAKYTGQKFGDAGQAAAPAAKTAWERTKEGAGAFGTSVREFFTSLFD